ncbi:Iron-sulfur cluster repair protein YtfE [Geobacillus stearothermophilus]|uniref:hemerythrin domain-containing protein n=1 Tax=Geobacillus sp. DSP4a TaxID=2508873 RepID=UPI0007AC0EA1|nr:hemerythrin domain-containing protein [Geobacillus sp. DSP4a]KZE97688.1 Iron-sulfur cluster repair protein YtfE [Geobacillus stearothermophilus]NNU99828.1 hemerythrin domain-containing protein [Geobacillus sp. DSP4a]
MHSFCHMGGPEGVKLCAGLAQLKQEHGPLRAQMEQVLAAAEAIGQGADDRNWRGPLADLREKVESFVAVLDPHSEREEGVLFPMMAKYIGRTTGPIAVMEYEHEQAKARLSMFLEKTAHLLETVDSEQALTLAGAVVEAHHILDEHFMKEENVLFPMAERLLSDGEKEELFARMNE